MAIQISLTKKEQKMAFAGLLCIAFFGYAYIAFVWIPISQKKSSLQTEIFSTDARISEATSQAEKMPRLKSKIADLERQAREISRQLPNKKGVGDTLVILSELARRHNIAIVNFSPGPNISKPYFIELQYPLVIEGQFHDIGKFFAALSLEERLFNIQDVSFGSADPDTGIMQVRLTLLTYQYKI